MATASSQLSESRLDRQSPLFRKACVLGLKLVLGGYVNFIEDKSEWKGTEITFEIAKRVKKTSSTSPTWA
jgi:hypothetical protein